MPSSPLYPPLSIASFAPQLSSYYSRYQAWVETHRDRREALADNVAKLSPILAKSLRPRDKKED